VLSVNALSDEQCRLFVNVVVVMALCLVILFDFTDGVSVSCVAADVTDLPRSAYSCIAAKI